MTLPRFKLLDVVAGVVLTLFVLVTIIYPALVLVAQSISDVAWNISSDLYLVARSVLDAMVIASVATVIAAILAVLTRGFPLRVARGFDLVLLAPATVSPFVMSQALSAGLFNIGSMHFLGTIPYFVTFVFALSPIAYALLRISLATVRPTLADAYRVLGSSELAILWHTAWPRLRHGIPIAWLTVFILAVSDPVVPAMVSYPHPNAARSVLSLATALGDTTGAARLSIVLLLATIIVGAVVFLIARPRDVLHTLRILPRSEARYSLSQPVGVPLWPRVAAVCVAALLVVLPIIVMLADLAPEEAASSARVLATACGFALVTVVGSLLITSAGMWFKTRMHGRAIDVLFGAALIMPGATTGTGLSLAYGPSSILASSLTPGGQSALSSLLTGAAYLAVAAPVTYMSVRAYGEAVPRRDFETALMLGATPIRAARIAAQTRLRHSVTFSITAVLAVSAVSVAPIMWVTSPTTPLLVPHLYNLLDRADYGPAFSIALSISALILLLIFISAVSLRLRAVRTGGRL